MKEAIWGVLIVALGLLGIVIVQTFQNVTVTNDQNYYLLKETTEAAMLDAVDLTYYRSTGKVRIVEDKFVENFTRRFAESAIATQDYDIVIHSVIETPPFVSVSLGAYVFSLKGDTFNIRNSIDSIIETKYSREKYEESKGDSIEFTCLTGECDVTSCITGDLRFTGWGSVALPSSQCKEGFTVEDIERDANYQVCNNGTWENKKEEVKVEEPEVREDCITYTWNFKKESELHDIDVTTKEVVEYGNCVESFTICPPGGITIYVGKSSRLTPSFNPSNVVNKDLSWTSSNTSVLVQGNTEAIVTGDFVGNAVITARSSNNKTATCDVKVVELGCPSQPITMDPNSTVQATLENGVVPSNAIWRTGNDNYATIDSNGKITSKDMYGTYWYYVEFNNTEVECPFFIKNPQQKDLIVTCDKENMNIYEKTTCTVKSSVKGEVLTGATLACTNNNKKVEPISNSNNTIVCSPEEVGELVVTATKATYTPGSDSLIVSEIGKPTLVVDCVKGGTDTTPLSTGINFNTPITCSVSGYETADLLSFVYKSYDGTILNTVIQNEKKSISITTGNYSNDESKGVLILTAKKGTQEVIKYFEVGCVPGDMIANFDITNEAWPSLPDLCPQHFDLRLEEEGGQTIQLYTIEPPGVPTLFNSAQFCGVNGNTDQSGKDYSITGLDETLTESKNYRSYFDKTIYYNWPLSLATPTIYSETGKYTFYKKIAFNFDKIDSNQDGDYDDENDVIWSNNVHPYVGTSVVTKSHTFTGDYLKSTDTYCTELEEQYPLSPNQPTRPTVTLSVEKGQYYIIPEQTPEFGYFIEANISPSTAFSGVGEWKTLFNNLSVKQDQWNWKSGRVLPTGNGGGTGTILFIAYLTDEARIKYNTPYISATVNFEILKNCNKLYLEIENTDATMIRKNDDLTYYENVKRDPYPKISINEKSPGNTGKWELKTQQYLNDVEFIPVVDSLSSSQDLYIQPKLYTDPIVIEYERTLDKTCKKTIEIMPFYDNQKPIIEVKYKNQLVNGTIYLKLNDSFSISDLVVTATDNDPDFGVKTLQPLTPVVVNTNIVNTYDIGYRAIDEAGNPSEVIVTIVISKLEIKPPICIVSYSSPSGYSGGWTNKDITVTGTCLSQGGASCNDTISYTFTRNTNTTTAGPGPNGGIGQVCDSAGNCATCEATATVRIDTSFPTCVVSGGSTSWFNTDRTIIGTCSDTGGSGCSGDKVSNTFTDNFRDSIESPGTIRDGADNTTECGSAYVRIDKIVPKCSSSGGSTSWTNSAITLTGTCTDTGSGCVSNVTKSFVQTTELYNQSPGTVYDKAGNNLPCPSNQTVKIDTTNPSVSITGSKADGSWTNQEVGLTGSVSPTSTISGYSYQWYKNGIVISGANSPYYTATTTGIYTLRATTGSGKYGYDNYSVNIDTIAPKCAVSTSNNNWSRIDVVVTGTCSDEGGSKCATPTISHTYTEEGIKTSVGPGLTTYSRTIYDNAGNSVVCAANQTVKIDKTKPTCVSSGGNSSWTNQNITIIGTCSDPLSGCVVQTISKTYNTDFYSLYAGPGSTEETRKVYDKAGNSSTCPANQIVMIDKTAPTCVSTGGSSAWRSAPVTIYGECTDNSHPTVNSGCNPNIYHRFKDPIDTKRAGPGPTGKVGSVEDKAGNKAFCEANQQVRIK